LHPLSESTCRKVWPAGDDAAEWIERRRAEGKPAAAVLIELETMPRKVKVRPVETVPDRDTETRPGDRTEAALAGLAAAAGTAAIGDGLRQLGEALRGADPLTRGLERESALAALEGKVKAPALLVDAALNIQPAPVELAMLRAWAAACSAARWLKSMPRRAGTAWSALSRAASGWRKSVAGRPCSWP
jgi:hypothetical protein